MGYLFLEYGSSPVVVNKLQYTTPSGTANLHSPAGTSARRTC